MKARRLSENIRDAPDPELVDHRGHDVFVSYSAQTGKWSSR